MTISLITPLPAAPDRATDGSAQFSTKADAFTAAMKVLGDQLGVTIPEMNTDIALAVAAGVAAGLSATAADVSADAAQAAYAGLVAGDASASSGTSASSVAIGTGAKSFTASTGKLWYTGMFIILRSAANAANFMTGTVVSYDVGTGALQVTVTVVGGSGTHADWQIFPAGGTTPDRLTLIASTTSTGAGPWVFTSIPQIYSELVLFFNCTKDGSGTNLVLNLSGDNDSTRTGNIPISTSTASAVVRGAIFIPLFTKDDGYIHGGTSNNLSDVAVDITVDQAVAANWRVDGGIDALRIAILAGTLTTTNISLYGR